MSNSVARHRGLLFVVSAPSGTGKTTLVEAAVRVCDGLARSRSYTSRPRRPGEREGVDYNFVSRAAFDELVARDEFLEWAEVFGNRYGTRRRDTEASLDAGLDVVLVIDVQGARQVRARAPDAIGIFVLPPSFAALEQRLRERCQDSDGAIERRLRTARSEITAIEQYDYVIVNDELDRCVRELMAIVQAERARRERRRPVWEKIVGDMTSG
jgi:guanylate kinase